MCIRSERRIEQNWSSIINDITLTYSHLMAVAWELRRMMAMVVAVVEGDIMMILVCSLFSISRPFTGPSCLTVTTELAAERG